MKILTARQHDITATHYGVKYVYLCTCEGATSPHSRYPRVDLSARLRQDLRPRGLVVGELVGWIVELVGPHSYGVGR